VLPRRRLSQSSDIEAYTAFRNAYLKVLTSAPRCAPSSSWSQLVLGDGGRTPTVAVRAGSMSPTRIRGSEHHARPINEDRIAHRPSLALCPAPLLVAGPLPNTNPAAGLRPHAHLDTAELLQELRTTLACLGVRVRTGTRRRRDGGSPARSMHTRPRPAWLYPWGLGRTV
jgi:hypothetical protein